VKPLIRAWRSAARSAPVSSRPESACSQSARPDLRCKLRGPSPSGQSLGVYLPSVVGWLLYVRRVVAPRERMPASIDRSARGNARNGQERASSITVQLEPSSVVSGRLPVVASAASTG
jgi:hypothetical protein